MWAKNKYKPLLALSALLALLLGLSQPLPLRAAPLRQAPSNNNFANAANIVSLPYTLTQSTTAATNESNDPVFPCAGRRGSRTVWFAYTAPTATPVFINTAGSNYDTILGVWQGSWGSLTNVACNDDTGGGQQSAVSFTPVPGTTYFIEVASYGATSGQLTLNVLPGVSNDDFAGAIPISATPYANTQDTTNATTAPDDPLLSCGWQGSAQHSRSVWYRFTAPANGILHVDTANSSYDTLLAIWRGARGALSEVACHDDVRYPTTPVDLTSAIDIAVEASVTYYIEIVAYSTGVGGTLHLQADFETTTPGDKQFYLRWQSSTNVLYPQPGAQNRTQSLARTANASWTLTPAFARRFALQQNTARVNLYIETTGQVRVKVDLYYGATHLGVAEQHISANGWVNLNISNPSLLLPPDSTVRLVVTNNSTDNRSFSVRYNGSDTYASLIAISTSTYVNVETLRMTTACNAAGTTRANPNQTLTFIAKVTDPFGSYDIAGADIYLRAPNGSTALPATAMTPGASSTDALTYTYAHTLPALAQLGQYTAQVTGTESNGIQASRLFTFTVEQAAALTGKLSAAPATVTEGDPITVTMRVTNTGQAAARNVTPGALTPSGTGAVAWAAGPTPASAALLAGGASAAFTWRYTAVTAGAVSWTGAASATDDNDCRALSTGALTTAPPVTILPIPPVLSFAQPAYTASENAGSAVITVRLNRTWSSEITVNYAAANGTAQAGSDYTAISGPLTFAPGVVERTFSVPILNDALDENDETVILTLSNGSFPIAAPNPVALTILDDDPAPTVAWSAASLTVDEGIGSRSFAASLSAPSSFTITVNYSTADGTAQAGSDYTAASGTLVFAPGAITQNILLFIVDDTDEEADENFTLALSAPTHAALGSPASAAITITDNDAVISIGKTVTPAAVTAPGPLRVFTYTLTITNNGAGNAQVRQITDTLATGFTYVATVEGSGLTGYDPPVINGQTITWNYPPGQRPNLGSGSSGTLIFTAAAAPAVGVYCNRASVQTQNNRFSTGETACVTVAAGAQPSIYRIEARVGGFLIVARIRLDAGQPTILSWEIQP